MCCKIAHEIFFVNIKNDEVINHKVILIRGSVNNRCDLLRGHIVEKTTNVRKDFEISKVNNVFKVLWSLAKGLNSFQLSYCTTVCYINLIYQESTIQHRIQPLYLVCQGHDGHFNAADGEKSDANEACRKISLGLQLVQCLYAEELLEKDFGRKTFTLNSDCVIFESKLNVRVVKELDENSLWNEFGREILNSRFGDDEKLKFVAFIGCTEYEKITNGDFSYDNIKRHTKAHANLGGGGLALFGSGYLYCWPSQFPEIVSCFENNKKIDLERFLDDSNYRRTYGGCYATTIGAVCHELGHILDLGHTNEGIMGNGFDYVNLVFTSKYLTEDLPNRVVDTVKVNSSKDHRLTTIKTPGNFLQKYHSQKTGNFTLFTRNCAIVLSLHKWLNTANSQISQTDDIQLNSNPPVISCTNSFLRLIEIRNKLSNLVIDYVDLVVSQPNVRTINLSGKVDLKRHSLFIITSDGSTKYFA